MSKHYSVVPAFLGMTFVKSLLIIARLTSTCKAGHLSHSSAKQSFHAQRLPQLLDEYSNALHQHSSISRIERGAKQQWEPPHPLFICYFDPGIIFNRSLGGALEVGIGAPLVKLDAPPPLLSSLAANSSSNLHHKLIIYTQPKQQPLREPPLFHSKRL